MTSYLEQYSERFYQYLYDKLNPYKDDKIFKQINSFMTSVKEEVKKVDSKTTKIQFTIEIRNGENTFSFVTSRMYQETSHTYFESKREEIFSLCASMLRELFVGAYWRGIL